MVRLSFKVTFLADHDHLVPKLAGSVWREWGFPSEQRAQEQLHREAQRDVVPSVYVALGADKELLGMVSLIECNLNKRADLYPWLAGLFVLPDYRGIGVGTALTRFLERDAARLGHHKVYLYTEGAESYYKRMGWRTFEHFEFDGESIALMSKSLT